MNTVQEESSAGLQPYSALRTATVRPEDVPEDRAANVKRILDTIARAKHYWKDDFDRMRRDMDFAAGKQYADQQSWTDSRYILNLVLRHIRLRTALLYAKNPKAVYRRKPKMDFLLWDENPETLMMAEQQVLAAQRASMVGHNGGPPLDPMAAVPPIALQIIDDYQQGMARRMSAARLGRALELLWDWFIDEPLPSVRTQMKAWVRRAVTCGVGYAKIGYQRQTKPRPDQAARLSDMTQQLAVIERLRACLMGEEAEATEYDAQAEQLRQAIKALQEKPEVLLREGPVLDFPRATAIIPDPATRSLRGWVGTGWIAEEFSLPASKVEEIYGVRVSARADATEAGTSAPPPPTNANPLSKDDENVRFWQFYEWASGRCYTVAEGHPDYLREPEAPEVELERFFPYYALTFNDVEHETRIFPPSDVELLRSPQDEYNRTRESLRQHRIANRPLYAAAQGAFDGEDKKNLAQYPAHAVVILNNLKEGQAVKELFGPVEKVPIDSNVYEVESLFSDTLRATGAQEANFGGASGATATEVAEASRSGATTTVSDTDELDEVLTEIARDFGQVCLLYMSPESVQRVVGPGIMWPRLTRAEIAAEGVLEVEAGSSGRPNRERDLANFERAVPFLLQIPGIDPVPLARYGLRLLDDRIDLADFIRPGLPSITAMNSARAPSTGDPATDPAQQGPEGAGNAPSTQVRPGGPQPAYGPSGNDLPVG